MRADELRDAALLRLAAAGLRELVVLRLEAGLRLAAVLREAGLREAAVTA